MKAVDVPQADSLSRIRELVQTVQFGATDTARIQKVMTLHPRHVGYHLHAARVLGWLEKPGDDWEVAKFGAELVATAPGSQEERAVFCKSIKKSPYLQQIAPNLLDDDEPEQDLLSLKIQEVAGIAPATARRRASTLLRWRTQSLPTRLRRFENLFMADDSEAGSLKISAIHVERYGCLRSLRVELDDRAVFIGANATGKSTVIDVLTFIRDVLHDGVRSAVMRRSQALSDLVWFGEGNGFAFAVEFLLPKSVRYDHARARYELEIGQLDSGDLGVIKEALYLSPREIPPQTAVQPNTPRGWRKTMGLGPTGQARYGSEHPTSRKTTTAPVGNDVSGLSQLPDDPERFPAARRIRAMLSEGIFLIRPNTERIAAACSVSDSAQFKSDGEGFALFVKALSEGPLDTFNDWKRHLREVVPTLVDVHVSESNGQVSLLAEMRGGARIPVSRLSDGAINAMLLTAMSFREQPDAMYVIESPERGIHPSVIEPLAQALNRATGPQMLLVTYSPHWVAAVPNAQLRCFVRESGALRVVQGVQLELNDAQLKQLLPIAFSAGMV